MSLSDHPATSANGPKRRFAASQPRPLFHAHEVRLRQPENLEKNKRGKRPRKVADHIRMAAAEALVAEALRQIADKQRWSGRRGNGPAFVSSCGPAEAVHLRLSQSGSVEPAA